MSESLIIITLVMTAVPISLFYIEKAVLKNKQKNNLIKRFESKLDSKLFFSKVDIYSLILLFIIHIVLQSFFYTFESIDWDISSYLVASSDILRFNVPYEVQWESKQPIFYLIYAFLIFLSGGNLIVFKILSDIYLFAIISIMYLTTLKLSSRSFAFFICIFYLSLMSQPWASAEFSEVFSLIFIALSYFLFINKKSFIIIGFLISISSLINAGSSLFIASYLLILLLNKDNKIKSNLIKIVTGFSVPHLLITIFYIYRNEFFVYYETFLKIPATYTNREFNFINEIFNFLKSIKEFNDTLFLLTIFIISSIIFCLYIEGKKISYRKIEMLILFSTSILFYTLAAHGYYHHMIYALYFFSMSATFITANFNRIVFKTFSSFIVITLCISSFNISVKTLMNLSAVYETYPLKEVSELIDSRFESDFTVLALDGVLTLFYLDKPNFSYIIHPSNHNEEFITEGLIRAQKIRNNEISLLIDEEPDVILCSNNDIINCEIYDYKQKYKEIDIIKTRQNPYLQYYDNQTWNLRLFIKEAAYDE